MTNPDTTQELLGKKLITTSPSASITDVVNLIDKHQIKRVVVAQEGSGLGIITEKDIVRFASSDDTERSLDEIRASEVMSKPLVTARSDAPLSEVANLMLNKGISSVVVSDRDELKGIITKYDLNEYYGMKLAGRFALKDFMSTRLVRVRPTHSIFYAAKLMSEHKISRLIVGEELMEGIVTYSDLVPATPALRPRRLEGEEKFYRQRGAITISRIIVSLNVGDVMARDVLTVLQGKDLVEAAIRMHFYGISGLPVLDDSMELVGIVTKTDIVRALARA